METRLSKTQYLCGNEKSIADISACCELDSSKMVKFDLSGYPKVKAWLHNMIDECPIMLDVHQYFRTSIPTIHKLLA